MIQVNRLRFFSAARNRRKNGEFVAVFDDFVAVCVGLVDGEKQGFVKSFGQCGKFFEDGGECFFRRGICRKRKFDFRRADDFLRRAEKLDVCFS